jgi:hypothetical protein
MTTPKNDWEARFDEEFSQDVWVSAHSDWLPSHVKKFICAEKNLSFKEGQACKGKAKREAYQLGFKEGQQDMLRKVGVEVEKMRHRPIVEPNPEAHAVNQALDTLLIHLASQ